MTFEVETGERKRIVEVSGGSGRYNAILDGKALALDVVRVDHLWSIVVDAAESGSPDACSIGTGRSYEVAFGDENGDELVVYVNRRVVVVRLNATSDAGGRQVAKRTRDTGATRTEARHGAFNIMAPMPGRVVRVLVNVGDQVGVRQGVAVVEAMKMENEIRAPRAGTVKEVRVTQGALVEARTVLIVIE